MRVLIQRVTKCHLFINGAKHSEIGKGLLILLGVGENDTNEEVKKLSRKITTLRIFSDEMGKMNLSVKDIDGEIMLVSQFTLWADTRKGNRPSFINAAPPDKAIPVYEAFIKQLSLDLGKEIATGVFGSDMQIELTNDGPVTIWMDTDDLSK